MHRILRLLVPALLLLSACGTPVETASDLPVRKACMRNDEGYLCSVRISDYAGHEGEIDWTKTKVSKEEAYSINLIDEFPAGCGMKPQEDY